ncbi:MAG: peptidase T [Bacillota bacterium]
MEKLIERFLRYVSFDTASNEECEAVPSTSGQMLLAKELERELHEIGLSDVELDERGYLFATLPSNTNKELPVIGFLAHIDTSSDASSVNIKPQIISDYKGGDIVINPELGIKLSPAEFPDLNKYIGCDLITTDGTTLLGADDKAGIAEIIAAVEYLIKHPEIPHGKIRIGFTPDEEIARGTDHFDVEKFGADFAYTIDGGEIGELEFENFNAAKAVITINGRSVHPGRAKNKMKNSLMIAMELSSMLPQNEVPAHTEGYEGFFHLEKLSGRVETTVMTYIIRDFDKAKLIERKERMVKIADYINDKYGKDTVQLELKDQYYNMREKVEPIMHIVDTAKKAMEEVGVTPLIRPIRGGTDGANLAYKGLCAPNIFTGGHNYHGRFEYVPIQSMQKAVEVILKIVELYSK